MTRASRRPATAGTSPGPRCAGTPPPLSDTWRPTRHLTVTGALSHIWAVGDNSPRRPTSSTTPPSPPACPPPGTPPTTAGRCCAEAPASTSTSTSSTSPATPWAARAQQRCRWNEPTQAFDLGCVYSGGLTSDTVGLPCGPTGIDSDGTPCHQALQLPRTTELTFGSEREVVQGLALSLDLVYRKFANQYHTRETNRIWNDDRHRPATRWAATATGGPRPSVTSAPTTGPSGATAASASR